MKTSFSRRAKLAVVAAGVLSAALLVSPGRAGAAVLGFNLHQVGGFGGEPSITSDSNGVLYDTSPSGPETFRSNNAGVNWTAINSPDNNSGDDCLNTDQGNSLYWCNLASMTVGSAPLQADVWKGTTPNITSCTMGGCTWAYGNNATTGTTCSTSCNPFGVDRQWVGSYIKTGNTTANAEVVLMYHDFYGPSHIWVNISHDGGHTFGTAQEVLSGSNFTTAASGAITAEGYTFCNTVPAGVGIAPPGTPHAGRIYVAWIASDLAQDATGCNVTMLQSFHTLWVAYSDPTTPGGDDAGAQGTWVPQMAFDIGLGHDASTPFVAFTLDTQGNPYLAFAANHWDSNTANNLTNVQTCASMSATGGEEGQLICSYNMYVVWSADGGADWDGMGGNSGYPTDPTGSATAPYVVNSDIGTDVFPTIAAGAPGQVDVSYLHTTETEPTTSFGKFQPGGCAGPDSSVPTSANYPPRCSWNLFAGQATDLTSAPGSEHWTTAQLTSAPMHHGDICNLGIFCVSPDSDRSLLDFNQEALDPTTGCAHIAYADNASDSPNNMHLVSADQTQGCFGVLSTNVPEAPLSILLPAIGLGGVVALGIRRRRGAPAMA